MVFDFPTSIPPQISKSVTVLLFPLPVIGLGHVNSGQGYMKGILLEGSGKCLLSPKVRYLPQHRKGQGGNISSSCGLYVWMRHTNSWIHFVNLREASLSKATTQRDGK